MLVHVAEHDGRPGAGVRRNRAGEGFENKIAETVAKALGETVEYTWLSYRGHGGFSQFLASTLDEHKCDVVMDIPYGSQEELTTRPYYISSYIFVFKKDIHRATMQGRMSLRLPDVLLN